MATITQRKAGYQAQVRRKGYPTRSKCFAVLRDAEALRRVGDAVPREVVVREREPAALLAQDVLVRHAHVVLAKPGPVTMSELNALDAIETSAPSFRSRFTSLATAPLPRWPAGMT